MIPKTINIIIECDKKRCPAQLSLNCPTEEKPSKYIQDKLTDQGWIWILHNQKTFCPNHTNDQEEQ